jgi:hypothetical protein
MTHYLADQEIERQRTPCRNTGTPGKHGCQREVAQVRRFQAAVSRALDCRLADPSVNDRGHLEMAHTVACPVIARTELDRGWPPQLGIGACGNGQTVPWLGMPDR